MLTGLASLFDCTAAFSSAPTTTQLLSNIPKIQPRRHRSALYHSQNSKESASSKSISRGSGVALQRKIATLATSAALFAAALAPVDIQLTPSSHAPWSSLVSVGYSQALALTENQQFVADVWFAVTAQFFDPTFNGLGEDGWRAKEKEALRAVADTGPDDEEVVLVAINHMLAALDDPYTRFLPPDKYETLTAYATGGGSRGAGIGVQLLEDPRTQSVMVMATTPGGPAALAGVQAGDTILSIDGESMDTTSADVVAAKCRGEPGTKVEVKFLRRNVDDENGSTQSQKTSTERITLTRAKIKANPLEASTFVSEGGRAIGVLRVPSFSTNTVTEMVEGLRSIREGGTNGKALDALAIDLRGNVGGYMPAGVDAAKLFLPAGAHITAEVDRPGGAFRAYDADGIGAETVLPVYLIVDARTASASEIFAAALQDNRRARVVGAGRTFGKGRIQNVQALDGGGVAVTRARYVTPRGRDLQGVGIAPDVVPRRCQLEDSARTCLAEVLDGG